ncbi:MAG: AAA-like domain-containing protein [Xenococcaceae cyanobacterium MO_188.B29]|nr:AAA-like domain-containing protein [Xenococcaceae cyanobacterium MO_188.B29]
MEKTNEVEASLLAADNLVFAKTGKHLTTLQAGIFRGAWLNQKYEQIAQENFCSDIHVKRVGAELWELLSLGLEERVNKKTFRAALERRQSFNSEPKKVLPALLPKVSKSYSDVIEFPNGSVPLHSHLYIERTPIEARAYSQIKQPGSLIRIKAPNQMGKTSLLLRILDRASKIGMRTVTLNLHQAEKKICTCLDQFLRWFCFNISRKLKLEPKLDDYWDENMGSKVSCTAYFQGYLLAQIDSPIVLALDEVNQIFEYPEIASEFLSLLRSWHEEAKVSDLWQKLRLVVVHSTEVYIPLNINQSPFNVGLPIRLPMFTTEQVKELVQRHGFNWANGSEIEQLMEMVNGHPYLVRVALYHLSRYQLSLEKLLKEAATLTGIYSNHLRRHWVTLQKYPELKLALQRATDSQESIHLEAITAYKLENMGLIKLNGNCATPSCELYRLYFRSQQLKDCAS